MRNQENEHNRLFISVYCPLRKAVIGPLLFPFWGSFLHHIRAIIEPFLFPFWGSFLRDIRTVIGPFLFPFWGSFLLRHIHTVIGSFLFPFWGYPLTSDVSDVTSNLSCKPRKTTYCDVAVTVSKRFGHRFGPVLGPFWVNDASIRHQTA